MKFKKIPKEYSTFICDKLTRFKPAVIRFKILFDDILTKYVHDINLSSLNEYERAKIAISIINSSFEPDNNDEKFCEVFKLLEERTFLYDSFSDKLLSEKLHLTSIIKSISVDSHTPQNVLWLKTLLENLDYDLDLLREKLSTLYPLTGVILCEGQTEYTLLEEIFSLYGIQLSKLGLTVIPAGGKNQVARKYYELIEYLKLKIYILLDNDAVEIKKLIDSKLRDKDKLYLIKSGEFEDLIPVKILLNTINSIHNNDFNCNLEDFEGNIPMSHKLDLIYKKYGYGEFKKAQFAKELNQYIRNNCTKADFDSSEIKQIINSLFQ